MHLRNLPSALLFQLLLTLIGTPAHAMDVTLNGPEGSSHFGQWLHVLSNGNVVVCDPTYSPPGGPSNIGSASLYRPDGELISLLTGSQPYDQVCRNGIVELANGNYLIGSDQWKNGSIRAAGALTWGSATTGVSGTVSAANSLVGNSEHSDLGTLHEPWDYQGGVLPLANGNYLVLTPRWGQGADAEVGAVTLGDGALGTKGLISAQNSLVGAGAYERLGDLNPVVLKNGNVLIASPNWGAEGIGSRGAVALIDAATGRHGVISADNALVGSSANDRVGHGSGIQVTIVPLESGNAIVLSPHWDNNAAAEAGAITWLDGVHGTTGVVSATNSVIGSSSGDSLGYDANTLHPQVTLLEGGGVVIASPNWTNASSVSAGAATWFSADAPTVGVLSAGNSLIGTVANGKVGRSVVPLSNGHFVVAGENSVTRAGGSAGVLGEVTAQNSFVARTSGDFASAIIRPLTNGNFVVLSPSFDGTNEVDVGALTWFDGTVATTGVVSETNSLVGTSRNDFADTAKGLNTFPALPGGGFVLLAHRWSDYRGALIFGDGVTPLAGSVSAANAVLGSQRFDFDLSEVHVLTNGNFAVRLPECDCGGATNAGAVLWGSGTAGVTGVLSPETALVDQHAGARLGTWDSVVPLPDGDYVIIHTSWDHGSVPDVGKVLRVDGSTGRVGQIDDAAGLQGASANDQVGLNGITPLSGSGFVVQSSRWNSASDAEVGAVSMVLPGTPLPAIVSAGNSLVGNVAEGRLGAFPPRVLSDGTLVLLGKQSATWLRAGQAPTGVISAANSLLVDVPALSQYESAFEVMELGGGQVVLQSRRGATWVDRDTALVGQVSDTNSLVPGGTPEQPTLEFAVEVQSLADGNYVVISKSTSQSPQSVLDSLTLVRGTVGIAGRVTPVNSIFVDNYGHNPGPEVAYDPVLHQIYVPVFERSEIVARSLSTMVTLSANPDPATRQQPVTLTAFVLGTQPGGTVEFRVGEQTLLGCDAVPLQGTGDVRYAVCTFVPPYTGRLELTAHYAGNASNDAATSHESALSILPAPNDILSDGFEEP